MQLAEKQELVRLLNLYQTDLLMMRPGHSSNAVQQVVDAVPLAERRLER